MSENETRLNPWLELGVIDHTSGALDTSNRALQKAADLVRGARAESRCQPVRNGCGRRHPPRQ
jgi:hypothetical protein